MENYIVRVYRRNPCGSDDIVGNVECVENAQILPFRGMAELVAIFSACHVDATADAIPEPRREPRTYS